MILLTYKKRAKPYLSGETPTFATVLLSILLKAYGTEALEWDGATIQMQVKEDFEVEMPRRVYDQLMALISALTTDTVYAEVDVFDETVNALCRRGIGAFRGVPPALDVAWAVTEIEMADPEPIGRDPKKRWNNNILRYIRVVLDDEGLSIAPKTLGMVKDKPASTHETSDPAIFAASWHSKQRAADEIDRQVEDIASKLIKQLADVGVAVPMEKLGQVLPDGTKVVEVDGMKIRNTSRTEFIGGGHSEVYPEIPKDEIWVEKDLKPEDKKKILLHEVIERALMRQEGQSYDKAHETATRLEAKARGNTNQAKTAEWTSEQNKEVHALKHGVEFGGVEGYLQAEAEHAAEPAGDEVAKDMRCRFDDPNGPSCTVAYQSKKRGTVYVKRLSDGRTVTLYKATT